MKILKNSVVSPLSACLLFTLGGGGISLIAYVTYATSCTNSTPAPTPTQLKPIPFTDEYFAWTTDGDELTITGLQDNIDLSNYDTLSIPATYTDDVSNTYFITSIGENAFWFDFYNTKNSNIINLNLANASFLENIQDGAFERCNGFTSLTIGNSVTSIGDYAFYNCSGFTGSLTIPNSVTSIGDSAFNDCSGFVGSLIIPNSVTDIGVSAFFDCSGFTGTLTIGNSVTSIGSAAFQYTKFTNVINHSPSFCLADNVGSAKVLIPASSGTSLDYERGSVAGKIAFGQLTIPFDVTTIGSSFSGCQGLTGSLVIPDSVDRIRLGVFQSCSGFTGSLIIPNSVTSIDVGAFYQCSGFKIIDISSWTDIPTIGVLSFGGFNADGGTVLVPVNYDELGISISTFPGLPDTWQLVEV